MVVAAGTNGLKALKQGSADLERLEDVQTLHLDVQAQNRRSTRVHWQTRNSVGRVTTGCAVTCEGA